MSVPARAGRAAFPILPLLLAACFNPSGSGSAGGSSSGGTSDPGPTTTTTTTLTSDASTTAAPTSTVTSDGTGTSTTTTQASTGTTAVTGTTGPVGCGISDDCPPELPVCDGGLCRVCRYHDECIDSACDIAIGRCFPPEKQVFDVDPNATCGLCGVDPPCCSINDAVAVAAGADQPYVYIRLLSTAVETTGVLLQGDLTDKVIAIVGDGANPAIGVKQGPVFDLDMAALRNPTPRVYVWKVWLSGSDGSEGVQCDNGRLWLDRVRISDHLGVPGLIAVDCDVSVRRSTIVLNRGAISTTGGTLTLHDSAVGGSTLSHTELEIGQNTTFTARYATVVDEDGGNAGLIQCIGATSVHFENSLVVGLGGSEIVACDIGTSAWSVVAPGALVTNGDNSVAANLAEIAFGPDYRLQAAGGPPDGRARWHIGYSPVDIDGALRPVDDGAPDYAGADIPQ